MPISDESEMIRFALPKILADEIRELQRDLGDRDPKPGKFFRDRTADLIQRERQRLADNTALQSVKSDLQKLQEKFDRFLGVFQKYAEIQTKGTSKNLEAIAKQLEDLNQQINSATFAAALGEEKKK